MICVRSFRDFQIPKHVLARLITAPYHHPHAEHGDDFGIVVQHHSDGGASDGELRDDVE